MGRNTSISLGNHFESFIETTVSKGRFTNASEVVRAGLRLLEEEENRIMILRSAIREGIESGISIDFDPKKHLETLKFSWDENNVNGETEEEKILRLGARPTSYSSY